MRVGPVYKTPYFYKGKFIIKVTSINSCQFIASAKRVMKVSILTTTYCLIIISEKGELSNHFLYKSYVIPKDEGDKCPYLTYLLYNAHPKMRVTSVEYHTYLFYNAHPKMKETSVYITLTCFTIHTKR